MSIGNAYGQDARNMIADMPQVFTFSGADYTGAISELQSRTDLDIGGFNDRPLMTLVVALKTDAGAAVFATVPDVNNLVTVNSVVYRIKRSEADQLGDMLELDLESPNK